MAGAGGGVLDAEDYETRRHLGTCGGPSGRHLHGELRPHDSQGIGIDIWGRWPWTIHSAGWGIIFNVAVCWIVSANTQDAAASAHRQKYHDFLAEHASLSPEKQGLVPMAWGITLAWMFFGIGPGAVIGNWIFGAPNAGYAAWTFGIPSIWAWQILFWALGVGMMWLLAYKMEMSTVPETEIEALVEDIGDVAAQEAGSS